MQVYRKSIIISPDPCISTRNLSTSSKDSESVEVLISPIDMLFPIDLMTLERTVEADMHGFEDTTEWLRSSSGSPTRYLNLDSDIFTSLSDIILDPPLPDTPLLNSLQFRDS